MTVFAGDEMGHQLIGRTEDAQRLTGQGSGSVVACLGKAMFAGGDTVAIENVHLVARYRLRQDATAVVDQWQQLPSRMSNQLSRYVGLDTLEFVVKRGERDRDAERFVQVGRRTEGKAEVTTCPIRSTTDEKVSSRVY